MNKIHAKAIFSIKNTWLFICILLLAAVNEVSGEVLSPNQIKSLTVRPDSDIFFTARENGFTLRIPGIKPGDVQTDIGQLPAGIKLISSKKEEFFDQDNQRGTVFHLWFTFTDTGLSDLPPLILRIGNRTYYLPFQSVPVYENPNLIAPALSIEFANPENLHTDKKTGAVVYKAVTGQEILFTVNIQYFIMILSYRWQLPKDSIYMELKHYDTVKKDELNSDQPAKKEFTPQKYPVADFSWRPLKEGIFEMPPVFIEAISYNGARKQLSLPPVLVEVTKGRTDPGKENKSTAPSGFESAFSKTNQAVLSAVRYTPTVDDSRILAQLRSRERHDSLLGMVSKERKEFEKSIGLVEQEDEPHNFITRKFGKKCGIFAGGNISPVPEEKTMTHHATGGQHVYIIEEAAEWIYIENKDFSGWVKKTQVFEIK